MRNNLAKYFDLQYFKRFIAIFLVLYYFNILYIGIITPGGFYFPFLKQYFDYPSWLINIILHFSNVITHSLGLNSYVKDNSLSVQNGSTVIMEWACIGLQIISFWTAFVIAHRDKWKKKIIWLGAGTLIICLINCCRIALLSLAMEKDWRMSYSIDNHTMFNLIGYIIIALLIYCYNRLRIKETV
jgi:exosortase/archaeosortase family protein